MSMFFPLWKKEEIKEGDKRGIIISPSFIHHPIRAFSGLQRDGLGKLQMHVRLHFLKSALSKSPYFDVTAKGSTILGSSYDKAEAVS